MKYTFADRYAEAGLSPSSELIKSREATVNKILDHISDEQKLDLVNAFYGCESTNLEWFRDALRENDASFSLVGNQREARVLAALILETLIDDGVRLAILAVCTGSVNEKRVVADCHWLVGKAESALLQTAVTSREAGEFAVKITPTQTPKLADEMSPLASTADWQLLASVLVKIRNETLTSSNTMVKQISSLLNQMNFQMSMMREESQMLWWLTAGFSNVLDCYFSELDTEEAAVAGAIDLANLTVSELGPIAIPAMLDRVISFSKTKKPRQSQDLESVISKLDVKKINLDLDQTETHAWLMPISTALKLSAQQGKQGWKEKFLELTGFDETLLLEPRSLGLQLYREIILGQLL
ncbi:GTPase-associated system all-helical protein GASH [Shewanella oncorhynchi]|uniref:GTPase-associated system all-helical protein GASH n=1 Tax=Shewanella oncorhynchi TaxID=2726434 RepID=UPI003D7AF7FD